MQGSTTAFGTVVISPDQMMGISVVITLPSGVQASFGNLSDCVESLEYYRQTTSIFPPGTSMVAGYDSVQPQITLAGLLYQGDGVVGIEGQDVYWLFNPQDPTSPMWAQTRLALPIQIKLGLYDGQNTPELITQFTGMTDDIVCSDGQVTISCLDNWATLTNAAQLPPVITASPYNANLTSEFAMDYLLRHASPGQYYSWPAPRANCVFAAGFRSSLWPEVGSYTASVTQTSSFAPGVFGTAMSNQGGLETYLTSAPITPSQSVFAECFATKISAGGSFEISVGDIGNLYRLIFEWDSSGTVFVFTVSPSGQSAASTVSLGATGSHYFAISAHWAAGSTTCSGTYRIDGVSHSFSLTAADSRPSNNNWGEVKVGSGAGTVEGVQVTTETSPTFNDTFTPTFIIDPAGSLNSLTALPDVTGKKASAVLQDIASAEAGVIGPNELGEFVFTNRQTIKSSASVRSITSATSLISLDSAEQRSLCATHIQVPVNQLQIEAPATVWSASSSIVVSGYSSTTFLAQTASPVVNVPPADSGFMPTSPTPGLTYWRASALPDGSAFGTATGITISVEQLSGSSLSVTVTNSNPFALWLVNPTGWPGDEGSPCLVIGGQAVTSTQTAPDGSNAGGTVYADSQWPPLAAGGAASGKPFGEVLLSIPASDWLQDIDSAQMLSDDLLDDLHYPIPMFTNVSIAPDATLQLLDIATLVDPDVSRTSQDALIFGTDISISNGTFTQSLDVQAVSRPGQWLLGVTGHSELGSTTVLY